MLEFIAFGTVPHHAVEESRVRRAASYYSLDDAGRIWVLGASSTWLRVPWMKDRAHLVKEIH